MPARRDALRLAALLGLLAAAGLLRPLLPIDETRYAAVAWEMWTHGEFLVPQLNGEPYPHKPPLLFWMVHAGWLLFGVNDWWPRLISPLFAAGTMALAARLGRDLWPSLPEVARVAPFVLVSSGLFVYFTSALMFDVMLCFFVALGYAGLVHAWRHDAGVRGFALLALAFGGALYAKGPVALVHLLPPALLAPLWMQDMRPRWGRWYAGVVMAVLGGAVLILAWAIPAAIAGGPEYSAAIFWGQSAGRMVSSFAHQKAWWFYLVALPFALLPWLPWPAWWRSLRQAPVVDSGMRLLLLGLLSSLLLFSLISGKQVQYLLPEFTLFALLAARGLADNRAATTSAAVPALALVAIGAAAIIGARRILAPLGGDVWVLVGGGVLAVCCGLTLMALPRAGAAVQARRLACAGVVAVCALLATFDFAMREPYDMGIVAGKLAQYQREGRPLAVAGDYHGEWTFAGRLQQPLESTDRHVDDWLAAHPGGRAVFVYREPGELPAEVRVEYSRQFRGARIAILASK